MGKDDDLAGCYANRAFTRQQLRNRNSFEKISVPTNPRPSQKIRSHPEMERGDFARLWVDYFLPHASSQ